jgi:hypothetical protein
MSLFEWFGESYNPGKIGSIEMGRKRPPRPSPWLVMVCFVGSCSALAFYAHFIWNIVEVRSERGLLAVGCFTLLYLIAGYLVHPKPDYDNMGWLGGIFDAPFRYSDDINRLLLLLMIVLLPGRFISESIVGCLEMLLSPPPEPEEESQLGEHPSEVASEMDVTQQPPL